MVASPECAVTASAEWLYMGKFLLTHAGFGAVVVLLLVPKLSGHHRALHSTNAVIALWTIALGEICCLPSRCICISSACAQDL